jgi:hypothetical protein
LAYVDDISGAGTDDQTATEVPFTPYLTIGSTNTQAAVQELKDELDAPVTYTARTTGNVTNAWGDGDVNYIASGIGYFNIPSAFDTYKRVNINPIFSPTSSMVFTSDNYTIRGNGTDYVNIAPSPTSGFVGVYVDSVNAVSFSRITGLTTHLAFNGYFKPYSISQVSGVSATSVTSSGFTLSWGAATASVGTISDYQYSIDGGAPVTVAGATTTSVTGLSPSTTYNVNVRAVDAASNKGQYSGDVEVVTDLANRITGKAGFRDSPSSTDISINGGAATIALNTDLSRVRTGTTSIRVSDTGNTTANAFVRFDTSTQPSSGTPITVSFWSKAESGVNVAVAGTNPFTNPQDAKNGTGDWQFHTHTFTSDGTSSRVYVYINGNPTTNNTNVFADIDDISITW